MGPDNEGDYQNVLPDGILVTLFNLLPHAPFDSINTVDPTILFGRGVLCIVGCLAEHQPFTQQVLVTSLLALAIQSASRHGQLSLHLGADHP